MKLSTVHWQEDHERNDLHRLIFDTMGKRYIDQIACHTVLASNGSMTRMTSATIA